MNKANEPNKMNEPNKIYDFKWSTGEKYEQSTPADKDKYTDQSNVNEANEMNTLLFDDGTDSCMRISNKREDANTKLNERLLIENVNQNPFLPRNNYINDLQVQDEFLKPRNSNFDLDGK
jgi:hypothetical protein